MKKGNRYSISFRWDKPQGYNKKKGWNAMVARWYDMKGKRVTKIKKFVKNHRWRYHLHVIIKKNGKKIFDVPL